MVARAEKAAPNVVLYNLRDARGWSQQEVAERLNALAAAEGRTNTITMATVSRWERGVVDRPDPVNRRLLAQLFDVSLEELGFTRPRRVPTGSPTAAGVRLDGGFVDEDLVVVDERVEVNQRQWRAVRRGLNQHRGQLTRIATHLYPSGVQLGDTGLIAPPKWLAPEPVPLEAVRLDWRDDTPVPEVTGHGAQTRAVRALGSVERRYLRYTQAIRELDRPVLFENRVGYRLLELDWTTQLGRLAFGQTTYFDMVDVCEAAAHELALAHLDADGDVAGHQPSWRRLPLRKLIGDPFDLARRPVLPSINTLTIRLGDGGATFYLHRRQASRVCVAGDLYHIMPAGVFQPSSVLAPVNGDDFDLWHNMVREFSEEFLGNPEHDGNGPPADYKRDIPLAALDGARHDGAVRLFCFGVGLDVLTLAGEILTVAVFDAEAFDTILGDVVERNDEGVVIRAAATKPVREGIPFSEDSIRRVLADERLAPAAAACLQLTWEHRGDLLVR